MQRLLSAITFIVFSIKIHCSIEYSPQNDEYKEVYANNTMVAYCDNNIFTAFIEVGDEKIPLGTPKKFYDYLKKQYAKQSKVSR